jgi:anti-sigma factor RsiW
MSMNEDILSGYLDDELTPDERAAVEAELAQSAEWRTVLEELRGTRTLLRTLPWPESSTDLLAGVRARDAAASVDAPPAPVRELHRGWRRPAAWIASAAVAAAVIGVVVIPRPGTSEPDIPALADAHAVRSSLAAIPFEALATLGVVMDPDR